jgi:O-antigen ligase
MQPALITTDELQNGCAPSALKASFFANLKSLATTQNLWISIVAVSLPIAAVSLSILLVIIATCVLLLLWNTPSVPKLMLLDVAVFLFACSLGLATLFAQYKPATIVVLALCICSSLIYYCVRCGLYRTTILLPVMGLLSLFYAIAALAHFIAVYLEWRALSFTRLVDFRAPLTFVPGLFANSSPSAFFLSALALALLGMCRWPPKRTKTGWIFVFSSLASFMCLLLTFSRGTYLALLCSLIAYAAVARGRRYAVFGLVAVSCVILALALSSKDIARAMLDTVEMRSTLSQKRSLDGRLTLVKMSAVLSFQQPLTGVGPGNFAYALQTSSPYQDANPAAQSYNLLLNTLVETGILGAVMLILVVAGAAMCLYRLKRTGFSSQAAILGSAYAGLLCLSLSQSFLFSGRATAFYVYALFGILAGESSTQC